MFDESAMQATKFKDYYVSYQVGQERVAMDKNGGFVLSFSLSHKVGRTLGVQRPKHSIYCPAFPAC